MQPGNKVKILREFHPNGIDPHRFCGKTATVRQLDGCQVRVSIDDFPATNNPVIDNSFWYIAGELEAVDAT